MEVSTWPMLFVFIDKGVNNIFICYKVLEFYQPVCQRVSLFSRRL